MDARVFDEILSGDVANGQDVTEMLDGRRNGDLEAQIGQTLERVVLCASGLVVGFGLAGENPGMVLWRDQEAGDH